MNSEGLKGPTLEIALLRIMFERSQASLEIHFEFPFPFNYFEWKVLTFFGQMATNNLDIPDYEYEEIADNNEEEKQNGGANRYD